MLHGLALHVPWQKRDKLVFVSLSTRRKVWAGFETWCENTFCCRSHWKSESHPEQGGKWRETVAISASLQKATMSPFCKGFSYKKGGGEALCTPLCQTPPHCVCWAWKLRHPPLLAFTEPAGHFAMHNRISCWFSLLKTGITKLWTASNSIKLNAFVQLFIGFGL